MRLIATHLGLWPSERRLQIRQLLRVVRDADLAPIILLGDLNEWFVWGRPVRWLHKQFKHTPSPASFPAGRPMLALDRIWVRPRQALRHLEVHMSTLARVASDHLPVSATLEPLDVRTLISILTEPKNALVKQYQKFFKMENSELEFTRGALELIAERALKRDTGARALRAVCEEIMLDTMYKLPDQQQGGKYIITEDVVEGRHNLFELKPERRKESA